MEVVTIDALRNLALALNTSADKLLFEPHEREPDDDLKHAFEAASTRLDPDRRPPTPPSHPRRPPPPQRSTPLGQLTVMAGIEEPETIDLVAQAADGRYLLVMVETRPWGTDPAQPDQLKAKINTYAQFALDGELLRHYPQAVNQPIAIQLDCPEPPDDAISAVTSRAAEQLAKFEVDVIVNINPQL